MKIIRKAFVAAFVVALAPTLALAANPVRPAHSPLLGSWSLDISRMDKPPEQRPKDVKFMFADAGEGRLTVHVDIVYAPGSEVHSVSTVPLNGTYAVIENSPEADHVALNRPTPNVLVMALQKDGVLVSTRIYSVMPDDHNLVETVVYPGSEDHPVMRANYFSRIRP